MTLPRGQSAFNQLYVHVKRRAKRAGRVFDLSEVDFFFLSQDSCHYCGCPPKHRYVSNGRTFYYNGLDRKDNSKGYTTRNCVTACRDCNVAKLARDYWEFRRWVRQVYRHFGRRKRQ